MLVAAFPKEALEFAWREHPEYLRTLPRGSVSMVVDTDVPVDELDAPAIAPRQSYSSPVARPTGVPQSTATAADIAPPTTGELSDEEASGVDNMFAAAAPTSAAPKAPANTAEIIARARAAASRNR